MDRMTNELLFMALNVIKEYCIDHTGEENTCEGCNLWEVCDDYFARNPDEWEMELVEE